MSWGWSQGDHISLSSQSREPVSFRVRQEAPCLRIRWTLVEKDIHIDLWPTHACTHALTCNTYVRHMYNNNKEGFPGLCCRHTLGDRVRDRRRSASAFSIGQQVKFRGKEVNRFHLHASKTCQAQRVPAQAPFFSQLYRRQLHLPHRCSRPESLASFNLRIFHLNC